MSEEIGQGENIANIGDLKVKSATSTHKDDSPIHFTDKGDNVQTSKVSENEEQSAKTLDSPEDSPEEKHPDMDKDGNQDYLVNKSEFTEENLPDTKTQLNNDVMLPDHHSFSTEPSGSTEETLGLHSNEDNTDKITEINQQNLPFGENLLLEASNGEGDGPNQLDCETTDTESSSAEHERPASAYTTSYEEYSLLLELLTEEQANTIEYSKKLHMKLAPVLAKKPKEEMERMLQGELHVESYEESLEMLNKLKLNMREEREIGERQVEELKMQAQEKLSKVDKECSELLSVKKEVAVMVMSRRMAKPDALAKVEFALASEERHQDELTRLRLQNFSLENRIRRLELEISEADRNATNPFQREYEKLHARRMERKKDGEKRHKEALRVQRRVERNVEMVSNIKQRLHCTETEIQHKLEKLAQVDAILAQHRDKLANIKQARNSLQRDNTRLKEQRGLLGNEVLLRDYDYIKQANAMLEEKLHDLKCRQADLEFFLNRRKKRFQTM
ncbi:coiled-coil domain-containing protein 96 [Periophthalmus magnuspinnatus]|uniref:coiled-coil domain-containing protein 96 n=1 Tax=Periophthalmus magnuspinnatus TaxID=409849 RepID=UPI00145ADED0|nr:coiled-coil domain-containing protein 96 [Periophthalmus magnuspinnatus]